MVVHSGIGRPPDAAAVAVGVVLVCLIQVLRRHRHPVKGAVLAEATGVSLRTLYRDIDALKAQGAHIDGEAGVGYVLRPGFMLPPLMFSEEEIEALVLEENVVDFVLGKAKVKETAVSFDDLMGKGGEG